METLLIENAGKIIGSVQTWVQFFVFLVFIAVVMFFVIRRDKKHDKALALQREQQKAAMESQKETQDKETQERIKKRDEEHLKRDHRIDELERTIKGVGKSLDEHFSTHKAQDSKIESCIMSMDNRLKDIEINLIPKEKFEKVINNVNEIEKNSGFFQSYRKYTFFLKEVVIFFHFFRIFSKNLHFVPKNAYNIGVRHYKVFDIGSFLDRNGWILEDLAKKMEASISTVGTWKAPGKFARFTECLKLLELGMTVEEMFGTEIYRKLKLSPELPEAEKENEKDFENRVCEILIKYHKNGISGINH